MKVNGVLENLFGFMLKDQELKGNFNMQSNQFAVSDFMTTEAPKTGNQKPKEAVKILYTNDASNVFIIITIAYPQQFLNILSNNITFSSQILFLNDVFSSYSLKIKIQLPYAYTLVNVLEPLNIDYYLKV
jgi:hypothetical protein